MKVNMQEKNETKWALVVEGGAMRGIFSTGILDAFIKEDYNPFEWCIGVSAGATNIAAYLAHMFGRNKQVRFLKSEPHKGVDQEMENYCAI